MYTPHEERHLQMNFQNGQSLKILQAKICLQKQHHPPPLFFFGLDKAVYIKMLLFIQAQ